jgi:hypothetical protein
MKQLKSSVSDLNEIVDRVLVVEYIAEPLVSFDSHSSARQVQEFAAKKEYDVIGVRRDGLVSGYTKAVELKDGELGTHEKQFSPEQCLSARRPISEVMDALRGNGQVFILHSDRVDSIITKGDLQKAPVRMWLFGLVSLLEMQLLRLIRMRFGEEGWQKLLTEKRMDAAKKMHEDRRKANSQIQVSDCLQFCDKRDILVKTAELWNELGFQSKNKAEKILKDLEELRDHLAHGQDIVTGRWPELAHLAKAAEELLESCERAEIKAA